VTLRICASVRRHRFGISEIGNLSTGFPRLHPHLLWKTIARRFDTLVISSSARSDRLAQQSVAVLVHRFARATSTIAVENIGGDEQKISTVSQTVVGKEG